MSNQTVTATGANVTASALGVGGALASDIFAGGWSVVAGSTPVTVFIDIPILASITAARGVLTGSINMTATGGSHSATIGSQLCDASAPGGATVTGPHLSWSTVNATRQLTTGVAQTFALPQWALHPSDLAAFAGKSLRLYFNLVNGTYTISVSGARLDYTFDALDPGALGARTPTSAEIATAGAYLGSAAFAPVGTFASLTTYPGNDPVSPSIGWQTNSAVSSPPQAGATAVYWRIAVADLPDSTDPDPLISAAVRHYRKAQSTGTFPSAPYPRDVRLLLYDRASDRVIGEGGYFNDTHQPQAVTEYNLEHLWVGRGETTDLFGPYTSSWATMLASGTLSLIYATLYYHEQGSGGVDKKAYNQDLLGAHASITLGPPPDALGCTPVKMCFGHLCQGDVSIVSASGSMQIALPANARHLDYEVSTGTSQFVVSSRVPLTQGLVGTADQNCLVSRPIPANSALTPGSKYSLSATVATSNGERHSYVRSFVMPAGLGTTAVDIETLPTA